MSVIRELTPDERLKYGECPVCKAPHGEACNPDVGLSLGVNANGLPPREGAHLARLQRAPYRVQEIPVG